MPPVVMRGPDGQAVEVGEGEVDLYASRGYVLETPEQAEARYDAEHRAEEFGGTADKIDALAAGIGSGLSVGLVDVLPKDERLKARIQENEGYYTGGQIAGAVLPALVPGGQAAAVGRLGKAGQALAKTPAGLTEALGKRAAARAGGGLKGAAARGVTEGAIHGAGTGISELSISDDPLTLERAISTLSSRALLGGAVGAGGSVFAKSASKGLSRASQALRDRAARKLSGSGAGVVDDIAAYSEARSPAFLVTKGEQKAVLAKQARRMRDALDAPDTLSRRPTRLAESLEKETKVLRELVEEGQEKTLERLAESDRKVAAEMLERLSAAKPDAKTIKLPKKLASEYRDMVGIGGKGGINLPIEKAQSFVQSLQTGELAATRKAALDKIPALLEQNVAVREAIEEAVKRPTKSMAREIAEGTATSYGLAAFTGLLPGGALGGAAAMAGSRLAPKLFDKLDDLVTKRLAKAGTEAAERTSTAVARVVSAGKKAGKAGRPAAPIGATKILKSASYAPEVPQQRQYVPTGDELTKAFRAREQEILSQVQSVAPGKYQMRQAARKRVAQELAGARAVDPILADRIETMAARRVEYLASVLPKRPDIMGMSVGPDRWRPSDAQMRKFARHVQAVEDPASVVERAASGKVTSEDVQALREVYPEQLADLQRQIIERLPEVRESLPYEKRLAISILTGVPVVPAMDPRILAVLQGQYADEPGTEGGTQAPRARPQFGSVAKKTLAAETPAQSRANPEAPA